MPLLLAIGLLLSGCNGSSDPAPVAPVVAAAAIAPQAVASDIAFVSASAGATPFIRLARFDGGSLANVTGIAYSVAARAGSTSKPVGVTYTMGALQQRGYVGDASVRLPVFGLYAGSDNPVTVTLSFADGSTQSIALMLTTPAYTDPSGVYDRPTIVQARAMGATLGFDFFALKSLVGPTIVIDTDGAIRWVGTGESSSAVAFRDNGFYIGSDATTQWQRMELDGTLSTSKAQDPTLTKFHHNLDAGKAGLLAEFDLPGNLGSTLQEITTAGAPIRTWDLAALIGAYMTRQGDDAAAFVRPGTDWFHMNASTYDPRDDTVIVSSRENFVVKLDYNSGDIVWIFGDPGKYWYSFPSLRAKALQLTGNGLYPVGQHAVSINSDGQLMLFNNGLGSLNQPAGTAAGETRGYSAVSAYAIDPVALTAQEVWNFDYGKSLYSSVCSSAYEAGGKSLLLNYAYTDAGATAHVVGLDANHAVVFDIRYDSPVGCGASWNAVPVPFERLSFQ